MTETKQLSLDLGHRAARGREDFMVAPCNEDAVAWLDRWPDWPGPALVIWGPPGCGKTHLAEVWRAQSGAATGVAGNPDDVSYIIDDADDPGTIDDETLFHLFNRLAEGGGHMLITSRTPPARWPDRLPDLMSRLRAAPTVAVAAPDDTLIAGLLIKLFADRQIRVGAEVVSYLVTRMDRSFEVAHRMVAAADDAALRQKRAVTLPLIRDVMAGMKS